MDKITSIFPTAPGLDQDLGSVGGMLLDMDREISGSMEFSEYYASIHKPLYRGKLDLFDRLALISVL